MSNVRRRSKMFFGTDGFSSVEGKTDAGSKLDKFLLEMGDKIEIISTELKFEHNEEVPSAHAILLLYNEKQLNEENLEDKHEILVKGYEQKWASEKK